MFNGRFDPERELDLLARCEVSVFCAPPTEYRLLVKQDLRRRHLPRLRHCTGAGEPLNPEVIHAWHDAFGLLIHDGYGQTETILLAANLPGLPIRPGSMGKPFPGHDLRVIGEDGAELPPARSASSRCAAARRRSSANTGRTPRRRQRVGAASGT